MLSMNESSWPGFLFEPRNRVNCNAASQIELYAKRSAFHVIHVTLYVIVNDVLWKHWIGLTLIMNDTNIGMLLLSIYSNINHIRFYCISFFQVFILFSNMPVNFFIFHIFQYTQDFWNLTAKTFFCFWVQSYYNFNFWQLTNFTHNEYWKILLQRGKPSFHNKTIIQHVRKYLCVESHLTLYLFESCLLQYKICIKWRWTLERFWCVHL